MPVGFSWREELGWAPATDFETGLRQTVRWYLTHAAWLQRVANGEYGAYYQAVYEREWGTRPS